MQTSLRQLLRQRAVKSSLSNLQLFQNPAVVIHDCWYKSPRRGGFCFGCMLEAEGEKYMHTDVLVLTHLLWVELVYGPVVAYWYRILRFPDFDN